MAMDLKKLKLLHKDQFLDFFMLLEKQFFTGVVLLISGNTKTMLSINNGRVQAYKSNFKRELMFKQEILETIKDKDNRLRMFERLQKLSAFEQWKVLLTEQLINGENYFKLLSDDLQAVLQEHFLNEKCHYLKTDKTSFMNSNLEYLSLFACFCRIVSSFKDGKDVNKGIHKIKLTILKDDVFHYFLGKMLPQHRIVQIYQSEKNNFIIELDDHLRDAIFYLQKLRVVEYSEYVDLKHEEIDEKTQTAFQILGLNENANTLDIKNKYFAFVKKYHPDKLIELGSIEKEKAEGYFSKITSAYNKINTKEKIQAYLESKQGQSFDIGSEKQIEAQKIVEAEEIFLLAKAHLKTQSYQRAHQLFTQCNAILEHDKYKAYQSWAWYCLSSFKLDEVGMVEAKKSLYELLQHNTPRLEALFFLANIEKKFKKYKEAKKLLQKIVERDPYFMTAKLELNLIQKKLGNN